MRLGGSGSALSAGMGGSSTTGAMAGTNEQVGDILFDDDIDPEDVDEDLIAKYFPIFEDI